MSFSRTLTYLIITLVPFLGAIFILPKFLTLSEPIDSYREVPIYSNGNDYTKSHGRHYHWSGYYFGQKWQCVEFIKRFYFLAKNHPMPDVWGHATDFYDPQTPHGTVNQRRNLVQFQNGGNTPPQPDDLIVFQDLTLYGHVAIVSEVTDHEIEVVQQNVGTQTRARFPLHVWEERYWVGNSTLNATGWLRLPEEGQKQ